MFFVRLILDESGFLFIVPRTSGVSCDLLNLYQQIAEPASLQMLCNGAAGCSIWLE
jgi:hypothetical protein